jgi:hypothetical protein
MKNTILSFIKSTLILLDPRKQVIGVDKETYSNLMELSKEMNTQDHLCTAMPYFFQVQHLKEVPCYEGQGTEVWADGDGGDLRTNEEIEEFIGNCIYDDFENHFQDISFKDDFEEEDRIPYIDIHINKMHEWDKEAFLEKQGYAKYNVRDEKFYSKAFFTAKACNEHIQSNKHHYREPAPYLMGNYRSYEMEIVMKFLCELSGGELHK